MKSTTRNSNQTKGNKKAAPQGTNNPTTLKKAAIESKTSKKKLLPTWQQNLLLQEQLS